MTPELLKNEVKQTIEHALGANFRVWMGDTLNHDELESITIEVTIDFCYGNCVDSNILFINWNDSGDISIEHGEDSVSTLCRQTLFEALYYGLVMRDLAEEYLV